MRDYSNYNTRIYSNHMHLFILLFVMMACCYWWVVSQSDVLISVKDRAIYVLLYMLGIAPVRLKF